MLASSSVTFSSLRCVFLWVDSVDWKLKVRPHWVHWNGLSPVWVLTCLFNTLGSEKLLSHFEQLNGFSPVWILSCLFK